MPNVLVGGHRARQEGKRVGIACRRQLGLAHDAQNVINDAQAYVATVVHDNETVGKMLRRRIRQQSSDVGKMHGLVDHEWRHVHDFTCLLREFGSFMVIHFFDESHMPACNQPDGSTVLDHRHNV